MTTSVEFTAMGSSCSVSFETDDPGAVQAFADESRAWARSFEHRYSRYDSDSLTSTINRQAGGEWTALDKDAEALLHLCDEAHELTRGCFDPSAFPLIDLWDYKRRRDALPTDEAIRRAAALVGWHRVERQDGRVRLPRAGMGLDLGGIGKEHAVDELMRLAQTRGMANVLVDCGQDLRVCGHAPGGGPWMVGLEDPLSPGTCWAGVEVGERAVTTSGDYRRSFSHDGRRYGHIIDPRTGWPVSNGCLAVTIIAPRCVIAGVLSTAAFILGPEEGIALIEAVDGAEGCIIATDGPHATSGFREFVVR